MHCYRVFLLCAALVAPLFADMLTFPPYGHSYGIRKATQKQLSLFMPGKHFNDPQGMASACMVSRDNPKSEDDDDEVVVYGVNAGGNQLFYNTSMWSLAAYGSGGSGKDQFNAPRGIACNSKGDVYVCDAGNNRVVQLFNPKKNVQWVRAFNAAETSLPLSHPQQVGIDERGTVYVSDSGNARVVLFSKDGRFLSAVAGFGRQHFVEGPTALAVADGSYRWSHDREEKLLFCADSGGRRLWKFNADGGFLARSNMPAGCRAGYAAIDYYHNLYITDIEHHCIHKFDHNLVYLGKFGSYGTENNQFVEPRGIAVYKRYGQIFVGEKGGAQYYWVGSGAQNIAARPAADGRSIHISGSFSEQSYVSIWKYAGGKEPVILSRRVFVHAGNSAAEAIIDTMGRVKGDCIVRVEATYSSYKYKHWDYPIKISP